MNTENSRSARNGYAMLFLGILFIAVAIGSLVRLIQTENPRELLPVFGGLLLGILVLVGNL